jgi:membrane-bound serine protease (ClpP class)
MEIYSFKKNLIKNISVYLFFAVMMVIFFPSNSFASNENNKNIDVKLTESIHFSEKGPNNVGYLYIPKDHPIDQSTYIYVKFALEDFIKRKVAFILLDLNTPGGEVFSSQKIAQLLQNVTVKHKIPVVAFVDNWAVSAGAMLAYSSKFIAVTNTSIMGAAEPVIQSNNEMKTASEKIISALRSEFSNLAKFYDRNPLIAQAMVDKDILLVLRDGEIISLLNDSDIVSNEDNPDIIISPKGKLLTLNAEEMLDWRVADFMVPLLTYEVTHGKSLRENSSVDSFLHYPFFKSANDIVLVEYKDWRVSFFAILSHPFVMSLLLAGVMLGFYITISSHGFGLAGSIATVCLALILLSSLSVYVVNWLELIIFVVGVALLAIEIFITPGFGVMGITGAILSFIGLFTLMTPSISTINFSVVTWSGNLSAYDFFRTFIWLCSSFLLSFVIIIILAKLLVPRYYPFHRLVLHNDQSANKGYVMKKLPETLPPIGTVAVVTNQLKPFGKIIIDDEIFDATAETGFIEKGKRVIIIKIEKNSIIVRDFEKK